jgi:arylsulfatase A-like enzyme
MRRRTAARTSALLILVLLFPIRAFPAPPAATATPGAETATGVRTSWDMLSALEAAGALPGGAALVYRGAHGETRAAIHVPLPGSVAAPVQIPQRARLALGYAFQAAAFMTETPELAEPGRVRVTFTDADGERHVLLDRRVDLRNRKDDRRWFDERIDLAPYAGQKGTLTLEAVNEGDAEKAKGTNVYFSAPRIVEPAGGAAAGARNLLLVTIDCLRADHVGAYGYPKPTTPTIDRIAAQGARFANAFANAPMTLPSVPQLFTSTIFPTKDMETFLEPVATAGIPSAAVVNNAWIPLWLSQGKHAEPPGTFDTMVSGDLDAKAITDRAIAWLERHRDERFVLYLHYLDTHTPYAPPKEYVARFADPSYRGKIGDTFTHPSDEEARRMDAADRKKVEAIYDAAIRYIDDQLARVLETLTRQGELERTVVLVTADHGEELWDHGRFFHGQTLYDELLHVPLVVRAPGAVAGGTVVERPVRMIDMAPALLEWAGLERPTTFEGRVLSEVLAAPAAPGDDLVATATQAQFPTRYALRTDDLKLIETLDTGARELFAIRTDPGETKNLAAERPEDLAKLEARLWAARAVLRERGYQVKVVGPQSGTAKVELRLASEPRSGTFLTIDRTATLGQPRLALSTDGEDLTLRAEVDARGTGFRFDRLLSPRNIARDDKLKIEILVDGKTLGHGALALGEKGAAATADVVDIADPALTSAAEPACDAPERGVRVCLWRYPGEKLAAMPEITDPAVREKLRALGYLQ